MLRLPANYALAAVKSIAPGLVAGRAYQKHHLKELKKQFNPDMPEKAAWTMLTELEQGYVPTIYYADWHSPWDKVAVGLSSINFADTYDQFLGCVDNLLPYSFEDIAYTVLSYQSNSDKLTRASRERLVKIGEYLKHSLKWNTLKLTLTPILMVAVGPTKVVRKACRCHQNLPDRHRS